MVKHNRTRLCFCRKRSRMELLSRNSGLVIVFVHVGLGDEETWQVTMHSYQLQGNRNVFVVAKVSPCVGETRVSCGLWKAPPSKRKFVKLRSTCALLNGHNLSECWEIGFFCCSDLSNFHGLTHSFLE